MAKQFLDFPQILSHMIEQNCRRGMPQPVRGDLPRPEGSACGAQPKVERAVRERVRSRNGKNRTFSSKFCTEQMILASLQGLRRRPSCQRFVSHLAMRYAERTQWLPTSLFCYSSPVEDLILPLAQSSNALTYDFFRFVSGPGAGARSSQTDFSSPSACKQKKAPPGFV
jgi:hypothetical protein